MLKLALLALAGAGSALADALPATNILTHAPRSLGAHGGFQDRWLARRAEGCAASWNGTQITGAEEGGACRWTVKYGAAARWEDAVAVESQNGTDAAQFPKMCPQSSPMAGIAGDPQDYSEDCLYMTVYAPKNATAESKLPVFVWIHGGAYIHGSATDAGLDGSVRAAEDNMIVVFLQYRLGILGFLPPADAPTADDPSLAVRDVVLALKTVQANIAAVGGDAGRVTVGGQSAGASMSRTLMATPSAQGLYHGLILQSDPINFGTQTFENAAGLRDLVYKNETLNCSDYECLKNMDVARLIPVQDHVNSIGPFNVTGVPVGEVYRPQFNTTTVTVDPVSALFYNPSALSVNLSSVPMMLTYTRNESGYLIDNFVPTAQPHNAFLFNFTLVRLMGQERGQELLNSGAYPAIDGPDGLRTGIEVVLTDAVWRCVSRAVGQKYAAAGGRAYVGEWTEGTTFSFNAAPEGYCTTPGAVCHSDDIYPTFASAPNATIQSNPNATTLANKVGPFWGDFVATGNPGEGWKQFSANSSTDDILNIGDQALLSQCPAGVWGERVPWDFMVFSNTTNGTAPAAAQSSDPSGAGGANSGAARLGGAGAAAAVVLSVVLGAVAVVF